MRFSSTVRSTAAALSGAGLLLVLTACSQQVATAEVGACMSSADLEGEIMEFPTVECSEEHDAQVVGSFELDGDSYPGREQVETQASEECAAAFEDFVGIPLSDSDLQLRFVPPTEQTWDDADDREVLCFALTTDGSTTTESWEGAAV